MVWTNMIIKKVSCSTLKSQAGALKNFTVCNIVSTHCTLFLHQDYTTMLHDVKFFLRKLLIISTIAY